MLEHSSVAMYDSAKGGQHRGWNRSCETQPPEGTGHLVLDT